MSGQRPKGVFIRELSEAVRPFRSSALPVSDQIRKNLASALLSSIEALVLADQVNIKVVGENIPLAALTECLSPRVLEELFEADAIRFVLWTPLIMVAEADGFPDETVPVVGGSHRSSEYADPEASALAGLQGWSTSNRRSVARLARLAAERTTLPDATLPDVAIKRVLGAFLTGDLPIQGLPQSLDIRSTSQQAKRALASVANDLLEASYVLAADDNIFNGQRPWAALKKLCRHLSDHQTMTEITEEILRTERVPSLATLVLEGRIPIEDLPRLRARPETQDYRNWLWEGMQSENNDANTIRAAYEGLIKNTRESTSQATVARGTVNAAISTLIGLGIGAASLNPVLGVAAGMTAALAQNLLDGFWVEKLLRTPAPRRFATDVLRAYELSSAGQSAAVAFPGARLPSHSGVAPRASANIVLSTALTEQRIIPVGAKLTYYED